MYIRMGMRATVKQYYIIVRTRKKRKKLEQNWNKNKFGTVFKVSLLKQIARFREQEVAKREEDYGS